MLDVAGYDYIRFDTLGDLPVTDDGFIRFDKNCTPGKTVPCGNACRAPQNCKSKGKSRVSEKGKELRENYASAMRSRKGLQSKDQVTSTRARKAAAATKRFGQATASEASLVDQFMKGQAKKKSRSAGAQKAAATRAAKRQMASDNELLAMSRANEADYGGSRAKKRRKSA